MKKTSLIKNKKPKLIFASLAFASVLIFCSFATSAQALTQFQVDSILNLLRSFGVEQEVVNRVETALVGTKVVPVKYDLKFERDLGLGSVGEDVKKLQEWLNNNGFKVAESGSGSPGNESTYFGEKTKQAVISYQLSRKIDPASGFFGSKTRASLNSQFYVKEKEEKKTEEVKKDPKKTSFDIIQSVVTDKTTYDPGEKIKMTIGVKNPSSKDIVLKFNSGCQVDYLLGSFRLMENVFCTQALTEVTVPAGKNYSWDVYHDLSVYPLKSGWHKIEAGVVDNTVAYPSGSVIGPRATGKIEVLSDQPSKTSDKDFIYCLKKAGVVIYGTATCPYCEQLVKSLGGHEVVSPIYVNCNKEIDRCFDEMQTRGVPEIQIKGVLYQGSRAPEEIGKVVGCPL